MGHGHPHHRHPHSHGEGADLPPALDGAVPDEELDPPALSRRRMLRRAGLLGAATAAGGALAGQRPASAAPAAPAGGRGRSGGHLWLAGDHHIHTLYSPDGKYRVADHVRRGRAHGLDWMVITDHGYEQHVRIGVEKVHRDILDARDAYPDALVFQGLEWNIPAAEHGTVFVHPGRHEVAVLKEFEQTFDGLVTGTTATTPAHEALAVAGVDWLAAAVRRRRVRDALLLANHPARRGLDSPHELRAWRDAAPHIAVGMEAAPGHQAAGIPAPQGPGRARGLYDMAPTADSFAAYPADSYRTWGGFDWMTATVGGLWDGLLAEGKPWWVTANSDAHHVYADTAVRGPGSDFPANGYFEDPVYSGRLDTADGVDYWPGQYSRTHVGAADFGYRAVMDAIRAGRVWVDHGGLVEALEVRVRAAGRRAPLGGTLAVARGTEAELVIDVTPADRPNWAGFVPRLARVDVVRGDVTGPARDRDAFTAPGTKVVRSFDVSGSTGTVRLVHPLGPVDRPLYVRVRGTDGNRTAPGAMGAGVDPSGPAVDVPGDADPWRDLWFYANPVFVVPE